MKKKIIGLTVTAIALTFLIALVNRQDAQTDDEFLQILTTSNSTLDRFTLDNGMVCLVKEDHSAPVCSIQFWVGTGAIHEGPYLGSGLSHAIEHMIFKGTATAEPGELTSKINDAGGTINAYTGYDRTVFLTDLPSRNWKTGLTLLADALMMPAFPEEEWTKEKNVILREIAMGRDDPSRVMNKLLFRTAYKTHPYKYPVIGYEDTFKRITRNDLASFYSQHYVSDNIIAVIVGDINPMEVRETLISLFEPLKRKSREPVVLPKEPEQISARFEKVTGAYKLSRLTLAYHTVPLSHPDAAALDVLAIIMGQGRSSRLSLKIKDELELAHSISAWSYTPKEPGLFGISAEFDPSNERQIISAIENEIATWTATQLTSDEIDKAKRRLLTSELSSLETMNGQADNYASGEFYSSDPLYAETYLKQINDITPQQLLETVRNYFRPENKSVVILSPNTADKDEPLIKQALSSPPKIKKHTLSNGMRLLLHQSSKLPFVYVCIAGTGGLLAETSSNTGITRLMSDLLTRGTTHCTAEEIALAYESLGGRLSSFSGRNSFGLQAKFLSSDIDIFMQLIADCMRSPTFETVELNKRKQIHLAAIDANQESPFFTARSAMRKALFPNHPYQWDEYGTKESVKSLSRPDMQKHFRDLAVSENLVLSVFGNIEPQRAIELAEKHFSPIPKGSFSLPSPPKPSPMLPARSTLFEPKEQAIILMGMPGIDVMDPRSDAISLLKDAMSGLSSRLSTEIRENRGLAYYSGAFHVSGIEPGVYVLYAGTKVSAIQEVESLMKDEIARVSTEGLTATEIERARSRMLAAHEKSLQDMMSISMNCTLNELYGLGYDYSFSATDRYNAITAKDVQIAARSILSTSSNVVSIVLPEPKKQTSSLAEPNAGE